MRSTVLSASLLACAVGAYPHTAWAGTCEDTFQKKGNPLTGLTFTAQTAVANLPADVAIRQVEAITARRGYVIMASEPQSGDLLIEQARSGNARGFPITVKATVAPGGVGTIVMVAKMPAAMGAKKEAAQTELCGILAEVKGGKEGLLASRKGAGTVATQAAPVAMSAQEFSQQISKDAERSAIAIPARYANRKFTLSGTVDFVVGENKTYAVSFKILQPEQMVIRLPNMASKLSKVSCKMAPGNSVYVMQLKPGKSVKLTGTFAKFMEYEHSIWLTDCVPAS
jgi:hypothetical protein